MSLNFWNFYQLIGYVTCYRPVFSSGESIAYQERFRKFIDGHNLYIDERLSVDNSVDNSARLAAGRHENCPTKGTRVAPWDAAEAVCQMPGRLPLRRRSGCLLEGEGMREWRQPPTLSTHPPTTRTPIPVPVPGRREGSGGRGSVGKRSSRCPAGARESPCRFGCGRGSVSVGQGVEDDQDAGADEEDRGGGSHDHRR